MADSELRPTHLPTDEHFARWAQRSRDQPLRMLSSACLTGLAVGYDGSDYGGYPAARALIDRYAAGEREGRRGATRERPARGRGRRAA